MSEFWCSGAEKKEGEQFCTFAMKVPKMKTSRKAQENNERTSARHSMMQVVDHMMKNPFAAPKIWGQIEAGLVASKKPTAKSSEGSSPENLEKVDLSWAGKTTLKVHKQVKAAQLAALDAGPSTELLDRIDDKDGYAIRDLFAFAFQYSKKDKFADTMNDLPTWTLMNKRRNQELGIDFGAWIKECVLEDGTVEWHKRPLFTPIWGEQYLTNIRYITGDMVSPPEGVWITMDWKFEEAFIADEARWVLGKVTHVVKDWYGLEAGCNKNRLDRNGKHLKELYDGAAAEIRAQQTSLRMLTNNASVSINLEGRGKRRREEALEKARKKLQDGSGPRALTFK